LFIYLYVICISLICGKNRITLKYKALRRVAQRHHQRLPQASTRRPQDARELENAPQPQVDQPQHDFNRAILPSIAAQLAIGLKKFYR
jgi:hypothetical protein